jgi:WXG100 protein secretion system (Wss), protein YukD
MLRIAVTIKDGSERRSFDMDLPGEVPVAQLIGDIVDVLEWPYGDNHGRPLHYVLVQGSSKRTLHEGFSLLDNGVVRGDVLLLAPVVEEESVPVTPPVANIPAGNSNNNNHALVKHRLNREAEELSESGYEVTIQTDNSPNGTEFLIQVEDGYLARRGLKLYLVCSILYPHIPPQILVEQQGEECHDENIQPAKLLAGWTSHHRLKDLVAKVTQYVS